MPRTKKIEPENPPKTDAEKSTSKKDEAEKVESKKDSKILNKQEFRKVLAEEKLTPNHRSRGRTRGEIKRDYAEYEKRKKIVFEAEERNFQHLVLFLASDGNVPGKEKKFYNMGGNSAIIYAYDIAPRIGKKDIALRPDLDNGRYKFKTGVTSIANLELLTEKLAKIGIERLPDKNGGLIVCFRLKNKYTKDMIKTLVDVHRDKIKEVNQMLYTNVLFPDIHVLAMDLRTTVYHKMMNVSRTDREVLQDQILGPVFKITDTYALMAHGDMDVAEAGFLMVRDIDILMDRVGMMLDLKLFDVTSTARIGKIMAGLRKLVVGKMINKEADKEDDKEVDKEVDKEADKEVDKEDELPSS